MKQITISVGDIFKRYNMKRKVESIDDDKLRVRVSNADIYCERHAPLTVAISTYELANNWVKVE